MDWRYEDGAPGVLLGVPLTGRAPPYSMTDSDSIQTCDTAGQWERHVPGAPGVGTGRTSHHSHHLFNSLDLLKATWAFVIFFYCVGHARIIL
ncbi:hypothetical protein XENTR_v10000129 [Xenopus tropicalis]|nr:hypothetical protein XENTR_v10000129 [Xenopus tropicalis]